MTHPQTAKMINDQISREFSTLNSIFTSESEKPAIMDRIRDLKDMLDNKEVMDDEPPTCSQIAIEAIKAFRDRQTSK